MNQKNARKKLKMLYLKRCVCVCVFCLDVCLCAMCMPVHCMCAWCQGRPKEDNRNLGRARANSAFNTQPSLHPLNI